MVPEWHHCNELCNVEWSGVGRPPVPWCIRFYAKVERRGWDDCWWWIPEKNRLEAGGRKSDNLNFTIAIPGYPRQVRPIRWMYSFEVNPIPDDHDIDHECEHYWCCNLTHVKPEFWLDNSGALNVLRGVYRRRARDPHGRYIIPGEAVRPTSTMGRKNTDDLSRDASGRFVLGR